MLRMREESKFPKHIEALRSLHGLKAENSVIEEALSGLADATQWILEHYQKTDSPHISIAEDIDATGRKGYGTTKDGEKIILLPIDELRKLDKIKWFKSMYRISEDFGLTVPRRVRPILTVKQWYESFAIEEYVHWLQDIGTEGLVKLPPREKILLSGENVSNL